MLGDTTLSPTKSPALNAKKRRSNDEQTRYQPGTHSLLTNSQTNTIKGFRSPATLITARKLDTKRGQHRIAKLLTYQ